MEPPFLFELKAELPVLPGESPRFVDFLVSTRLSSWPVVAYFAISNPFLKSAKRLLHLLATASQWGHMPESNLENRS